MPPTVKPRSNSSRPSSSIWWLDLMLPVIDRLSVCQNPPAVAQQHPGGDADRQDEVDLKVAALDIGADDYVVKPASYEKLKPASEPLIGERRREVEVTS